MAAKKPSFGTSNQTVPKEGPKVVPINVDLTTGAAVLVDLVVDVEMGIISFVQGVFIDNSENTESITVSTETVNQSVTLEAGAQGFVPLFASNTPKFTFQSAGAVVVPVFFYNVPLPACVWKGGLVNSPLFDGNGALVVSDAALEALIANEGLGAALNVNVLGTGIAAPDIISDFLALPAGQAILVQALGLQIGPSGLEAPRGNFDATGIASASRAAGVTTNSADLQLRNHDGIVLMVNASVIGGGGSVTVKLQGKDPVSGLYYDIPGAITTAIAAPGLTALEIHPAVTAVANQRVSAVLPRTIRISGTVAGAACTYSVGYSTVKSG